MILKRCADDSIIGLEWKRFQNKMSVALLKRYSVKETNINAADDSVAHGTAKRPAATYTKLRQK